MKLHSLCIALTIGCVTTLTSGAHAQKIRKRDSKARTIKASAVSSGRKRIKKKAVAMRIDFERRKSLQAAIKRNERLESVKRKRMIAFIEKVLTSRVYRLSHMRQARSSRLLQKGNLEFEEAKYRNLLKHQAFEKAMAAYDAGRLKNKPQEPVVDYKAPTQTYYQILNEDPTYHKNDEVRFRLGYCLYNMGKTKESVGVLAALPRLYPKSRYAADAYLQMGETWFEANKFVAAGINFSDLLRKYPRSSLARYARYKYAWSLFHQAKHTEAVEEMKKVIASHQLGLKRQGMNDLVVFWAETTGGWIKARQYFSKLGGPKLLERQMWLFAQRLDSLDKNEETLTVLDWLVKRFPTSGRAPRFHETKMDVLVRMKDEEKLEKGLRLIVDFYAPGSPWDKAQRARSRVQNHGRLLGEKAMAYVATYYHRQARKLGRQEAFQKAVKYYGEFLRRFPKSRQALALTFYLAEVLRRLKTFDRAADLYRKATAAGPSKFREDAAYQRIYCLAQLIEAKGLDRPVETKLPGQQHAKIPKTSLAPVEKRYVEASDTFVRLFPNSKDVPSVLYKASRIYYDRGQMAKAANRFAFIVRTHGKDKYAAFAGAMAMDAYTRIKDWPNVVLWARNLIKLRNFKYHSRTRLREIISATGIKAAEILEKRKDYAKAARALLAVVEEFPKSANAPRAMFNAAALLERAKQRKQASELYRAVLKKHKKTEFAARSSFVLGAMYEGQADFASAAKHYGMLAQLPHISRTADALYNAGVLLEALGKFSQAAALRFKYVKLFGSRREAANVFFSIGKLLERQNKDQAAVGHYLKFLSDKRFAGKNPTLEVAAWTRAGLTLHKSKPAQAAKYFANAEMAFRKHKLRPRSLAASYAAWAAYLRAEMAFHEFDNLKLQGTRVRLAKLFSKKTGLLLKAAQQYRKVARYGDCLWAAAAVFKLGELYARMVDSLYSIPVPKSLKKQEHIEAYKAKLQEMAQPIEEKAINRFVIAVRLAHKQRIYNQWTARAARKLIRYRPDAYPNPQMQVVKGGHRAEPLPLDFQWKIRGAGQ